MKAKLCIILRFSLSVKCFYTLNQHQPFWSMWIIARA